MRHGHPGGARPLKHVPWAGVLAFVASLGCRSHGSGGDAADAIPLAEAGNPEAGQRQDLALDSSVVDAVTVDVPRDMSGDDCACGEVPAVDLLGAAEPDAPTQSLCDRLASYAGTSLDASAAIQDCIDRASSGDKLALPPGRYAIAHQIRLIRPSYLATRGKSESDPPCDVDDGGCFTLVADPDFLIDDPSEPGLLWVSPAAAGTTLDHLVFDGNKEARTNSASAAHCTTMDASGQPDITYGYNVTLAADGIRLLNSMSQNALCGTGMEVDGKVGLTITNNRFLGNGVHDHFLLWADGLTVTDAVDSVISGNLAADNSDVDMILGGCRDCVVHDNVVSHSDSYVSSSFAAFMLTVWSPPSVPWSTGDFTGADIAGNRIDCSPGKRCGFGLQIGTDPWAPDGPLFGGEVHDNVIRNARQGLNVAHTTGTMHLYRNAVSDCGGDFITLCGPRSLSSYNVSTTSIIDRTGDDTPDESYTHDEWNACMPNP